MTSPAFGLIKSTKKIKVASKSESMKSNIILVVTAPQFGTQA